MKRYAIWATAIAFVAVAWTGTTTACGENAAREGDTLADSIASRDSLKMAKLREDSIAVVNSDSLTRYTKLSEADLQLVADELGIEVAAMKAVVVIEAGEAMKGFCRPGVPIINYDPSMYRVYAKKAPDKKGNPDAKVPEGLTGYFLKEWTQLTNARKKNAQGADMATFWGMFQIGGFNYKLCGCQSVDEFVNRMSYSELEQLELFAAFVRSTGLLKYLQNKDWAGFARRYNGASYARRGYHTRMAKAYARFKKDS